MKLFQFAISLWAACSWLAINSTVNAHEGPEHEIDELTERIKVEGESADLLLQRAIEYNVLRRGADAVKDLERALDFESHSPIILRELSRAYFSVAKTNEAFDTAGRGLKYASEGAEKASLYMVRAEISRSRKDYQKALDDVDKAIHEYPDNAEGYLARSLLQQQLGLKKERIKGLADGMKETGSGLLEAEWVDALIDGGKAEAALATIQAELQDARLRSSWLIRRAKVLFAMNNDDEAKADAKEALAELNQRLSRGGHDPLLLADRGQAYELLGNREEAKKDYEQAREKGVSDEWVREKIHALGGDDKKGGRGRRGGDAKTEADKDKKDETDKAEDKTPDKSDEKQ